MKGALVLLVASALGALGLACSQPASDAGPNACATCHMPEYASVKHPLHPGAKPTTCGVCHTQEHWHPSVLRHEWPLTGAHAKADCFACHRGTREAPPVFHGTGRECVDCHRADAEKVTFAAHATFGTACEKCHATTGWKPATSPGHAAAPGGSNAPSAPNAPDAPSTSDTPPPASTKGPAAPTAPTAKPRPKPAPTTPRPKPVPTTPPPDVVTHPSKR